MTLRHIAKWLTLLGLALALPAVLIACGSDEPSDGAATTPTQASGTEDPAATAPPEASGSAETDRVALVAFYNATDGPNWDDNENWLSDEPLGEWWGVTTDDNGRVDDLNLQQNGLSGEIPPELGSLTYLRWLRLDRNKLSGEIPPELGSLANLYELHLWGNQLSGEIPPELLSLANLAKAEP